MSVGQIQAPSALELWWVENRKAVFATLGVLAIGLVAYYGLKHYWRKQTDKEWSAFAATTGLKKAYVEEGKHANRVRQSPQWWAFYVGSLHSSLVAELGEDVANLDSTALDKAIADAKGTKREPLLIWVAANRAHAKQDFDAALHYLTDLERRFPDHVLCQSTAYPPQYRRDLNADAEKPDPAPAKPEPPKLADPIQGSVVAQLRERIAKEQTFATANSTLFTPPEPDSKQVAVFKTDRGEFRVAFFETAAPRHTSSFLQLVKDKHFEGMAFDQIRRTSSDAFAPVPEEIHIGLFASKQDDRTKWLEERSKVEGEVNGQTLTAIDWEDSRISHFPFMVAASPGKDGKSLPGRIWINRSDAASEDGRRVVFGRVIAGQDVIERLVESSFATVDEETAGYGTPRDTIRVQSVEIIDR